MKINELTGLTIEDVIEQFKKQNQDDIEFGCQDGACGHTAAMFDDFAAKKGFGMVERVQGFFQADSEIIPHQWNEFRDQIIDFTGHAQFVETGLSPDTNEERYLYKLP